MWIDTDRAFQEFCHHALTQTTELTIDLEFQGEGRYAPLVCLVQLGLRQLFVAVDPFRVNLTPLAALLTASHIRKIFHAGSQDIALLRRETGAVPVNVFDTQIAAAFLGYGEATGYAALVQRFTKAVLSKKQQFTDWTRRPLLPEQVEYALNDVRYLFPVYDGLCQQLEQHGRLDWVLEACADATAQAVRGREAGQEYLKIGKLASLSQQELAVLRELCQWREMTARARNRPVGTILHDDVLRQIAYTLPKSEAALRQMRGTNNLSRESIVEILDTIQQALALPESEWPEAVAAREYDPTLDGLATLLGAVLRLRAGALDLAPSLLATRDELLRFAGWVLQGSPPDGAGGFPLLQGWRRAVAGELLLDLVTGKSLLQIAPTEPGAVRIVAAGTLPSP
ncbi:MAG: HRDC domain-containing protein [Chloracidobacterium sp.]|uniref:HRDC domain-containing protein n=1 Tax=Chloracidobacterium validum TaxID=2821543 RepID=A0ABX8B5G6_9BACT|nr:HRDC domain-containing protein [Chloracidobacterium validum]QUW01894.1 HRDC domain-containing protein [Chloracidobacterium validum]